MKTKFIRFWVSIILCLSPPILLSACPERNYFYWVPNLWNDVLCDYSIYYGEDNLKSVAAVLAISGILANTNADKSFRKFYQRDIRSSTTDSILKPFNGVGFMDYKPIYVGTILIGHYFGDTFAGNVMYEWGYRSFRALLLVSPQISFLRRILGGGEPRGRLNNHCLTQKKIDNFYEDSKWRLFRKGRSSVSGHTFNGALPFLTAAMMTDDPPLKCGFYILSVLPGLARINNDKHYFSQVFLGWALTYLSVKTVDIAERALNEHCIHINTCPVNQGFMLEAKLRF